MGRGIALALAAEGAGVTVAARTESKVQAVAAEIEERGGSALALVCDVNELDDIQPVWTKQWSTSAPSTSW